MPTHKRVWASATLLVAICTIFGYAVAYAHESGYATFFRMPEGLIHIRLETVLIVMAGLFFFILLLVLLANGVCMAWPTKVTALQRALIRISFVAIFAAVLLVLYRSHWQYWGWGVLALAFLCFFEFGLPFLHYKKGTYEERLQAQEEYDRNIVSLFDILRSYLGRGPYLVLNVLIFITALSYFVGHASAMHQEEFLVLRVPRELVVLRASPDRLICASFDRKARVLGESFIVIGLEGDTLIEMHRQKIGPLVPCDLSVQSERDADAREPIAGELPIQPMDGQEQGESNSSSGASSLKD